MSWVYGKVFDSIYDGTLYGHWEAIVTMQQKHARTAGAVEEVALPELIDEALRLHAVDWHMMQRVFVADLGRPATTSLSGR